MQGQRRMVPADNFLRQSEMAAKSATEDHIRFREVLKENGFQVKEDFGDCIVVNVPVDFTIKDRTKLIEKMEAHRNVGIR
jgi:arginine deiminase